MIEAVILDCDGVLVDSEPAHFAAFRDALATAGLDLTEADYYGRYLACDDEAFFRLVFSDRGRDLTGDRLASLLETKGRLLAERLASLPVNGATFAFAATAMEAGLPVAVASGARRAEVLAVLSRGALPRPPDALVCAGEVPRGKPAPAPYLEALRRLCASAGREIPARACLVVEDSLVGVRAGRAAGMWVLALTTSCSEAELRDAHAVLPDLGGRDVAAVERLLASRGGAP